MLTRRDTVKLVLAGAVVPLLPMAAQAAPDWEKALQAALDRRLAANSGARFSLHRFNAETASGETRMTCVVTLNWQPGQMRRRITAKATTPDAAFADLETKALATFGAACPGTLV